MRAGLLLAAVALVVVLRVDARPPEPRAVRVAPAPIPTTAAERGRLVYARYGCGMCHGADGKGGFANANAETEGKVPGVEFVAEGYTKKEVRRLVLTGTPTIGKSDPKGPTPPYRMPGWRDRMTDPEADDLVAYLFSLYPESAGTKWR